jgi:hypothetical protein
MRCGLGGMEGLGWKGRRRGKGDRSEEEEL